MPYYLVTQTSLVEADDEAAAAEQVLATLQDAQQVTFTVKFDENNIRQVLVQRRPPPVVIAEPEATDAEDAASSASVAPPQRVPTSSEGPISSGARSSTLAVALFTSGALVGIVASFLMT